MSLKDCNIGTVPLVWALRRKCKRSHHMRSGWDGAHLSTCRPHHANTHARTVCMAALTGSSFSTLSSVFISDGCMPLKLTPYVTVHYKPDTHTQCLHADTCLDYRLYVCTSACTNTQNGPVFCGHPTVRHKHKQKNERMDDGVTR